MAQARNRGGPANGEIWWRWFYPDMAPHSELQNFNVEPNTQAIQDELIAQQQRYPQRFFYSIYLHDLVEGPGHPPRNGPAVPPPPVLPPGPAAGPSAASGTGTTAQATVSVPPQEEVVDPLAAGL